MVIFGATGTVGRSMLDFILKQNVMGRDIKVRGEGGEEGGGAPFTLWAGKGASGGGGRSGDDGRDWGLRFVLGVSLLASDGAVCSLVGVKVERVGDLWVVCDGVKGAPSLANPDAGCDGQQHEHK